MPRRTYSKRANYRKKATYRSKARKAYRSKRRYRKSGYQRLSKTVLRSRQPIVSDRYFCKLKYQCRQTSLALNATTAQNGSVIIRGNSLYDPEFSIGGTQPIGFDYLKSMYQYYKVHASKITIRVFNNSSASTGAFTYCTVYPCVVGASPPITSIQWMDVAGQPHAKYKLMPGGPSNNMRDKTLIHKMKSKDVLGCKTIANSDHQCNIGTNPAENVVSAPRAWYWIVSLFNADQETTTVTYAMDITMEYMCEFLRPTQMLDATLFGDPDGVNDTPPNFTGTYNYYNPTFGGSGSQSGWVAGPN